MKKLALIFPGIGYTIEKPLLRESMQIAERLGYELRPILYSGFPKKVRGDRDKMRKSYELALNQAREQLSAMELSTYSELLLIGKSIGTTVAACLAAELPAGIKVRFVLYTPLEETFAFPLGDAVVFTGSADPWVDAENSRIPDLCRQRGIPCFLTPEGNHSLETGDEETDLRNRESILLLTALFIGGLERPIHMFGSPAAETVLLQMSDRRGAVLLEREYREICDRAGEEDFLLLAVETEDWNRELSPWAAPAVFGEEDFGGGGTDTLAWLLDHLLPALTAMREERFFYLGGYSLAGLFALWAGCRTERFAGIAAVSPSVWFPGFKSYALCHPLRAGRVYLSLGDREERTHNPVLAEVGDTIRELYRYLNDERIPCILEWNPGDHFRQPELRTAAGFAWLLKERRLQRERIGHYEGLFREAERVLRAPESTDEDLLSLKDTVAQLAAYYEDFGWWQDYYDDDAGFLPKNMERGVLSEDGIYNLLERYRELLDERGIGS